MSREIKLRFWNTKEQDWEYDVVIKDKVFILLHDSHEWDYIENIEVSQYTGLTDKNGTEIYEGDIVEHTSFDDFGDKITEQTVVKDLRVFYHHMMYLQNGKQDMKIVGNIYEREKQA